MVAVVRKMWGFAIYGEGMAGNIVARADLRQIGSILGKQHAELGMIISACFAVYRSDLLVVNHPSLVPAALVVDHKQVRDVREHVDEGARIVGICRQTGLGL